MKTIKIGALRWTKSIAHRLAYSYAEEAHKVEELISSDVTANDEELRRVLCEQRSRIWGEYNRVTASDLAEITEGDVKRIDDALRREWQDARYDDVSDMLYKVRYEFLASAEAALDAAEE